MSTSGLGTIVHVATSLLDLVNVVDAACDVMEEYQNEGDGKTLKVARLVSRIVLAGVTTANVACVASGAKSDVLKMLKSIELGPRIARIPIDIVDSVTKLANGKINKIEFAEAVIGPCGDVVRNIGELSYYQEQKYLDMSPEELKSATRPVYEFDSDTETMVKTGERPVDIEECKKNQEVFEKVIFTSASVRTACELNVLSMAAKVSFSLYKKLDHVMKTMFPKVESLLDMDRIPDILHDDVILSRNICPITDEPIRHPVGDPNGVTVYEKKAAHDWVAIAQTSPMTRRPMSVLDLVEKPGLKAIIDHRLQFHQKNYELYKKDPQLLAKNLADEEGEN